MKYNQPANYTDDLKAVVTKPSPRNDGNWVMEVEPKDAEGNQLFTGENPGVVTLNGGLSELTTLQNAATAIGNGVELDVSGMSTVIFGVVGSFVGVITFEGSIDGTGWNAILTTNNNNNQKTTTATSAGLYRAVCTGLMKVRARISTYTSGSITVVARTAFNQIVEPTSEGSAIICITRHGPATSGTDQLLLDTTRPLAIDRFEFASNSFMSYVSLQAYRSGTLVGIGDITANGSSNVAITFDALATSPSSLFDLVLYDHTNKQYKMILKGPVYFPEGVKILLRQNSGENKNLGAILLGRYLL